MALRAAFFTRPAETLKLCVEIGVDRVDRLPEPSPACIFFNALRLGEKIELFKRGFALFGQSMEINGDPAEPWRMSFPALAFAELGPHLIEQRQKLKTVLGISEAPRRLPSALGPQPDGKTERA